MYKLLVVDDEEKIRKLISKYAVFEGYEVTEAEDGMSAVETLRNKDFDLVVLDIMLPDIDGFSVCRELRKTKRTPVIMLSARGEEYDKLFGFELGIDDYVVKPFSPKELMARITAVLARSQNRNAKHEKMQFGSLVINWVGRSVTIDGKALQMTPKEYELLFYMVKNRGVALTRERLISEVWGYDYFGDDRTLDTHIKMLRQNLGKYRNCIITLRSMGYKFEYQGIS